MIHLLIQELCTLKVKVPVVFKAICYKPQINLKTIKKTLWQLIRHNNIHRT